MGVAGVVVVWASARDTVSTEDEATSPNVAAHPRKASALRRLTCFGSVRSLISLSRFAALSEHVTSVESRVIDLDQLGRAVSSHAGTSTDGIEALGRCGMMVPAVTNRSQTIRARERRHPIRRVAGV